MIDGKLFIILQQELTAVLNKPQGQVTGKYSTI
jgi:hypothetical protein